MAKPVFINGHPIFGVRGGGGGFTDPRKPPAFGDPCTCCGGHCPPCDYTCPAGWAQGRIDVSGETCTGAKVLLTITDTSVLPTGWCNKHASIEANLPEISPGVWQGLVDKSDCYRVKLKVVAECCNLLGVRDGRGGACGQLCYDEVWLYGSFNLCCCYGGQCINNVPSINWPESISVTIDHFEWYDNYPGFPECDCGRAQTAIIAGVIPGTWVLQHVGGIFGSYLFEQDLGPLECECAGIPHDYDADFDPYVPPTDCCAYKLKVTGALTCTGFGGALVRIIRINKITGDECPLPNAIFYMGIPPSNLGDADGKPPIHWDFTGNQAACHGTLCYPDYYVATSAAFTCTSWYAKGICATW